MSEGKYEYEDILCQCCKSVVGRRRVVRFSEEDKCVWKNLEKKMSERSQFFNKAYRIIALPLIFLFVASVMYSLFFEHNHGLFFLPIFGTICLLIILIVLDTRIDIREYSPIRKAAHEEMNQLLKRYGVGEGEKYVIKEEKENSSGSPPARG